MKNANSEYAIKSFRILKKLFVLVLLMLFVNFNIFPQSQLSKRFLVPFKSEISKLYGYKDKFSGEVVVEAKYDYALNFNGQIAPVELHYRWGYIDSTGREVTPIKYDGTYSFYSGLAVVSSFNKFGYINNTGKEIVPLKYDYADAFKQDLAAVGQNGKFGFIDTSGKEIIPLKYDDIKNNFNGNYAIVGINGKFGFIDKKGKVILPFEYSNFRTLTNGMYAAKKKGKYGFISENKEISAFKYDVVDIKYDLLYGKINDKFIFMNNNGKEFKYQLTKELSYIGLTSAKLKNKYGFINKHGDVVIPFKFDYVLDYNEGYAAVCVGCSIDSLGKPHDGKWGFINDTGDIIIPIIYDDIIDSFKYGRAGVILNGIFYLVNASNEREIPIEVTK